MAFWKLGLAMASLLAGAGVAITLHGQPGTGQSGTGTSRTPLAGAPAATRVPPTVIGMNVSPLAYWSGERPFADPIQSNGVFSIRLPGQPIARLTNQVPTDGNGYPTSVPKGTLIVVQLQEFDPLRTGSYACRVSAGWSVTGLAQAAVVQRGTDFRLTITRGRWPLAVLNVSAQADAARLSELRCTPDAAAAAAGAFDPALIADLRPFPVIRFMNWMRANADPTGVWSQRPLPNQRSQAEQRGVALEHMVDLAARLGADPWFTLPLNGDVDYYRSFATYVRDHLPPDRRVYVEVSNEVWNGSFPQSKEATRLGRLRYPDASPIEANDRFYADRVRAVMAIWDQVFAGAARKRLVRVLASQAVFAQRAADTLTYQDTWRSIDALAVAPYFGETVQAVEATGDARLKELARRGPGYVDKAIKAARDSKAVAAKFGLPLIAYEAGPDFLGYNPLAKADAQAWHDNPALAQLYATYLERWRREIGGLIVVFDSAGKDGYGHKAYTGQPLADAPLMRTVIDAEQRDVAKTGANR